MHVGGRLPWIENDVTLWPRKRSSHVCTVTAGQHVKCLQDSSRTDLEQQGTQSKFPVRTKRTSQIDLGLGLLVKYCSDGASKVKPDTLQEKCRERRGETTLRKKRWADNADATLRKNGRDNRQQTATTTTPTTATKKSKLPAASLDSGMQQPFSG
ncbi:unnamed protein product [Polarella glacialis]|uniref:Uncharacterized protein n=1 Tax=Polarella glacialis TaxID=89957 RepID=A0A813GR63_POLGL|nr:unnamed protein product [Polarella glacialis]